MPRGRRSIVDAELAELGAAVKFAALKKEMDALTRRYPSLQGARNAWKAVRGVRATVKKRKRRTMSAKARAAISRAQKARWAAKRKAGK